jgi:hypothetical protein
MMPAATINYGRSTAEIPMRNVRKIGNIGARMKRRRVKADYYPSINKLEDEVADVRHLGRSMKAVFRGAPNSEEGIRNLETSEALTVLHIHRIEEIALRLDCG